MSIIHMENSRTVKKVFHTRPDGPKKIGRPNLRWDGVIQDTRALGTKNWGSVAYEERLAEASEEGQGPHRTVEPMMVMYVGITMKSSKEGDNVFWDYTSPIWLPFSREEELRLVPNMAMHCTVLFYFMMMPTLM
jgi:hypothetical protein